MSIDADYYRRGREVLGQKAGGVLTKLVKVKDGDYALARSVLEIASTKANPMEYVQGAIRRNGADNNHIYDPRL